MKPVRHCPSCEKTVELESVITAAGVVVYKCCNCFHVAPAEEFSPVEEPTTGRSVPTRSSVVGGV